MSSSAPPFGWLVYAPTRLTCQAPHPLADKNPERFGSRTHGADAGVTIPVKARPVREGEVLRGDDLVFTVRCRHNDCRATTLWVAVREETRP